MNFSAWGIMLPLRSALDLNYFNQYPTYRTKNMSVLKSENLSLKMGRGGGGVMKMRARELKSSDKVGSRKLKCTPKTSSNIRQYWSLFYKSTLSITENNAVFNYLWNHQSEDDALRLFLCLMARLANQLMLTSPHRQLWRSFTNLSILMRVYITKELHNILGGTFTVYTWYIRMSMSEVC